MKNTSKHKINLTIMLRRILLTAGFLFFLYVEYYNLRYTFDRQLKSGFIYHNKNFLLFSIVMILLAIAGFVLADFITGSRRITSKGFILALASLSFGLRLAFILLFNSAPVSDFKLLYRGAEEIVKGNYDFVKKAEYFLSWVYQIGFVAYQALIVRLFGQGYLTLKILNAVFSTGTCIMVYLTGKRVFGENAGRIAGLAYCFYPSSIYMCSVLTNQILSAFLFYIAMYLATGKLKKYSFIPLGIIIAFGNIIRPEGPIIFISIFTFILLFKKEESLRILRRYKQDSTPAACNRRQAFINALLGKTYIIVSTIIVFLLITKIFNFILINSEISDYPLTNRDPLWKFVVGLNYEEKGQYSAEDFAYIRQFPLGEERKREEINLIKERISDKEKLLELLQEKLKIQWSDFDITIINYVAPGTILTPLKTNVILYLDKCYYIAIILFILISQGFLCIKKDIYPNHVLYQIFILGFVFIHLFIEIQLRYRYLVMPAFFILGGFGICLVSEKLKNLYSQFSKRKHKISIEK